MSFVIGCDVGNAYAYASVARKGDLPLPLMPDKISSYGMPTKAYLTPPNGVPITVYYKQDPAEGVSPLQTVAEVKRQAPYVDAVKRHFSQESILVRNTKSDITVTPWQVYSAIVRDLVRAANETSEALGRGTSYDIVLTFPSVYAEPEYLPVLNRMQESIEDIVLNGNQLNVIGRLPEPAAAAIYYLFFVQHHKEETDRDNAPETINVLVYDLGHGTCDLALVTARSKGDPYTLHWQDGVDTVGGLDFENVIYDELCRQLSQKHMAPRNQSEKARLREIAHKMKTELSEPQMDCATEEYEFYSIETTTAPGRENDPAYHGSRTFSKFEMLELNLTRDRFEKLSSPLLERTLDKTRKMLQKAEELNIPIDSIVLTGGASQMPMVEREIRALTGGKYHIEKFEPSRAVSFGAAIYGAYGSISAEREIETDHPSNGILEQKTLCTYGIMSEKESSDQMMMVDFIDQGQTLPATSSKNWKMQCAAERMALRIVSKRNGEDIKEIERLEFDGLPVGSTCDLSMKVLEDYNVLVTCRFGLPHKMTITKKTGEHGK